LNPDLDHYTKTRNKPENTPKNAKKQQPTENQKNSKYQNTI